MLPALTTFKMAVDDRIKILNLEVDSEDVSDYRILVDCKSFKYVTIDAGVYSPNHMKWDRTIIPLLPPMPLGDWNKGHVTNHPDKGTPYFSYFAKVELPTILSTWHPMRIDWLELERAQRLRANIYTATLKKDVGGTRIAADEVVIKFARFPWEMQYFEDETRVYERLDRQGIPIPRFLAHLTEEGRVIGLVIEYIKDARHAGPEDLEECQDALRKLHRLGILHGDVNRHNFLVREADGRKTVTIVDLEGASDCTEEGAFKEEIDRLRDELYSTDGNGGYVEVVSEKD
jgi:Lipopolysaccharide kinase (Kdo/WaaP) family